jgi:hypothetical protein
MRHHHTDSPLRLAIVALQNSDGYVDVLLGLARDQIVARRPAMSHRLLQARFHPDPRNVGVKNRATTSSRPPGLPGDCYFVARSSQGMRILSTSWGKRALSNGSAPVKINRERNAGGLSAISSDCSALEGGM